MYDLIIIGAGPAGMTAGIYAARKKINTLILTKEVGGQMVFSQAIENYTGFSVISGADLVLKFRQHLESIKEDLELKEGVEVVDLAKNVTSFVVRDKTGALYYSRAVIICSGRTAKDLGVPGEKKFFGHGVAVCATCDAPLYKNKDVAVIGSGNSAMQSLLALSKIARRIYCISLDKELRGDEVLKTKVISQPNITFCPQSRVTEIVGDKQVSSITVANNTGATRSLPVDGVFIEIGWEPSVAFDHLTNKNQVNEIKVDQNLQTNVPGLFAAGDVNDAWGEQMIIAAGEGAKAALAAADFLAKSR